MNSARPTLERIADALERLATATERLALLAEPPEPCGWAVSRDGVEGLRCRLPKHHEGPHLLQEA
jgi:hypothetical protein